MSLNRTNVGLKPRFLHLGLTGSVNVESNQCGIETAPAAVFVYNDTAVESNQCGIETLTSVCSDEYAQRR